VTLPFSGCGLRISFGSRISDFGFRAALAMFVLALASSAARACAVCYGEPDSPVSKGLTWAIIALGAIVVCVLAGIVGFFVHANRSAAELDATAARLEQTQLELH
jgi:hypothetical protein